MSGTEQLEANKKLAREYIEQVFNQHKQRKRPTLPPGTWCGTAGASATSQESKA